MDTKVQLVGESPKFQEVLRTIELVSVTDVAVLLTGETGTGKEVMAQAIHNKSPRKQRQMITINCAALPDELAESLLFGHKKGAFIEATENNIGYISQARSSTLFLDEICELSLSIQAKLLRFLEYGEVQPVGQTHTRKYDVRIIAASNKNLSEEVKKGNFRADLFYRLNIIPVELPALREREGDTSLLMDYFFRDLVQKQHQTAPSLTKVAVKQLTQYNWPGNIRELRNFCERMFILFSGKEIDVTNLPYEIRSYQPSKESGRGYASPFSLPEAGVQLESVEVDLIQQALHNTNGNKSRAARLLGLTRDTFLYRLKKYSINI